MRQPPIKQNGPAVEYGQGEAAPFRACAPGLDFLTSYGAQRAGDYGDAPDFLPASPGPDAEEETDSDSENEDSPAREWGLETPPDLWTPIRVGVTLPRCDEPRPARFVDGKDVGRVVAYIAAPQGYIVPVRLAQIGAIALRGASREADVLAHPQGLFCETRRAERVVSFMADLFPWDEVERYAAALQASGFRLLISSPLISSPKTEASEMRNIPRLKESVRARTRNEMFRMEREAIVNCGFREEVITIADGLLDDKQEGLRDNPAVAGVIKSHANRTYLREPLWDTFYALEAGERTPIIAFTARVSQQPTLTWYLRLAPRNGDPTAGVIRVEILRSYFENALKGDFTYISRLSAFLVRARTRDRGYSRAAVTLYPIQRAEDALGACFCDRQRCDAEFYRLNGL